MRRYWQVEGRGKRLLPGKCPAGWPVTGRQAFRRPGPAGRMRWPCLADFHTPGLLFLLLIPAACGKPSGPPPARPDGWLEFALQNSVETLDPAKITYSSDAAVASLVFEGLLENGTGPGTFEPRLAERCQEEENGRRWVITLRQGVYFHDDPCFPAGRGREVVAADAARAFERVLGQAGGGRQAYLFQGRLNGLDEYLQGKTRSIAGIRIVDRYRLEFRLREPLAVFPKIISSCAFSIMPPEAVDYYGDRLGEHPVGTGPFRLAGWQPLERLQFIRHPRYWRRDAGGRRLPRLAGVNLRLGLSREVILAGMSAGRLHFFQEEDLARERFPVRMADGRPFNVQTIPGLSLRFLGFSLDGRSALAGDSFWRRRAASAMNYRELARRLANTGFKPASQLVPPALIPDLAAFEAELADEAGAETGAEPAGWPARWSGRPLQLFCNIYAEDMLVFCDSLNQSGIPAAITIQEAGYYEHIVNRRPDVFRVSMHPDFPDAGEYYALFYSGSPPDLNLCQYRNPAYDTLYRMTLGERDPAVRSRLFARLEKILRRDRPALPVSHGAPLLVITPDFVRGIRCRSTRADLTEAWLEDGHASRQ